MKIYSNGNGFERWAHFHHGSHGRGDKFEYHNSRFSSFLALYSNISITLIVRFIIEILLLM